MLLGHVYFALPQKLFIPGSGTLLFEKHLFIYFSLVNILSDHKVTVLSTVPTMLSMLEAPESLPLLRLLIVGGEACSKELIRIWSSDRKMVNSYGPTEATVICTATTCVIDEAVTIGKPIPFYVAYILDSNGDICSIGSAGELVIGGRGVARGYKNRDDLTSLQFKDNMNKLHSKFAPRVYKTGDLCRWSEDGKIEFMGRIDAQVKLRGILLGSAQKVVRLPRGTCRSGVLLDGTIFP